MKYIKKLKLFESEEEVVDPMDFLENIGGHFTLEEDGSFSSSKQVIIDGTKLPDRFKNLESLPVRFNSVKGDFYLSSIPIKSLDGFPKEVKGGIYLNWTKISNLEGISTTSEFIMIEANKNLKSLSGIPENIETKSIIIMECPIESLEGLPSKFKFDLSVRDCPIYRAGRYLRGALSNEYEKKSISFGNCYDLSLKEFPKVLNRDLFIRNCSLRSVEGISRKIRGDLNLSNNLLDSLNGCPEIVTGSFGCSRNQLTSLEGSPKYCESFYADRNELISLKGISSASYYHLIKNRLVSLEGIPYKSKEFSKVGKLAKIYCSHEGEDTEFFIRTKNTLDSVKEHLDLLNKSVGFYKDEQFRKKVYRKKAFYLSFLEDEDLNKLIKEIPGNMAFVLSNPPNEYLKNRYEKLDWGENRNDLETKKTLDDLGF